MTIPRVTGALLLGSTLLTGCGGGSDHPKTIPVTGSVAYKGKPLEGANVSFFNDKSPRVASGVTDAEGKFTLSTYDINDGAIAGDYKITVSKFDATAASNAAAASSGGSTVPDPANLTSSYVAAMNKGKAATSKSLIPEVYQKQDTTPLKETVKDGQENKFLLQLTD